MTINELVKHQLILWLFIFILAGCFKSPSSNGEDERTKITDKEIEDYWIRFSKINSRVVVSLNGNEIFDSGENQVITTTTTVGLSKYLNPGKNTLEVDLFNGPPYVDSLSYDKTWEIVYELFKEDIPIDYVNELNEHGRNGLVWSHRHELVISPEEVLQ